MAERGEAKRAKRSFASKIKLKYFDAKLCFALKLRFAQPFLAKFNWTINWLLSPQELTCSNLLNLTIFRKHSDMHHLLRSLR